MSPATEVLAWIVLVIRLMKRSAFKVQPAKGGWIRTTIAPINDRREVTFGVSDVVMFAALVVGMVAIARVLLAH